MFKLFLATKAFIIPLILLIFFLFFTSKCYVSYIYTSNFVDEEYNFVLGKYLLGGDKIYMDIFSHHQPVHYFISACLKLIKHLDNIDQLVKLHRYFMIFCGVLWYLLLFIRFRFYSLPFIVIYELTKIFLLGHTFLAESLVIYPLVYLLFLILIKKNILVLESIFSGILVYFVSFSLLPLWPLSVFLLE